MKTNNKNTGQRPGISSEFASVYGTDPLALIRQARILRQVELGRLIAIIAASVRGKAASLYRRHVVERELMALSDHMLADIGIHRSDIRAVAAGHLRRGETVLARAAHNSAVAFMDVVKRPAVANATVTPTNSEKPIAA